MAVVLNQKGKTMCGVPHGGYDDSNELVKSDAVNTKKLNVSDQVIAEMLSRVAAGYIPGNLVPIAENTADFAKQVVKSLLQFQDA